jgi:hypothetical protein
MNNLNEIKSASTITELTDAINSELDAIGCDINEGFPVTPVGLKCAVSWYSRGADGDERAVAILNEAIEKFNQLHFAVKQFRFEDGKLFKLNSDQDAYIFVFGAYWLTTEKQAIQEYQKSLLEFNGDTDA